eukprot:g5119.t1
MKEQRVKGRLTTLLDAKAAEDDKALQQRLKQARDTRDALKAAAVGDRVGPESRAVAAAKAMTGAAAAPSGASGAGKGGLATGVVGSGADAGSAAAVAAKAFAMVGAGSKPASHVSRSQAQSGTPIEEGVFGPDPIANAREARGRGRRKSSLLTLSGFVPHGHNMMDKLDRPPTAAIGTERVECLRWVTAQVRAAAPELYPHWYRRWRRLTQDGDLTPERFHRWMLRNYGGAFVLRVVFDMVRLIGSEELRRRLTFAARAASERSARQRWRGAMAKVKVYARFMLINRRDKGKRPPHVLRDGRRESLTHRVQTDPSYVQRLMPAVPTVEGKNKEQRKPGVIAMDKVHNARETFKLLHKQGVQFRTKSAVHAGSSSHLFADALRGLRVGSPMLTKLNLSWEGLGLGQAMQLGKALKGNVFITELDLTGNQLGNDGAITLGECLPSMPKLSKVRLGFNLIGCAGAAKVLAGVHAGHKGSVRELRLDHNTINEKDLSLTSAPWASENANEHGLQQVAYYMAANSTLQHLFLASNRIGDTGCALLARGLTQESTGALRTFDLSSNDVSDEGVRHVTGALTPFDDGHDPHAVNYNVNSAGDWGPHAHRCASKLEVLSFSGSHRITDAGGELLAELAGRLRTLTHVDLGKTAVSAGVAARIKQQTRLNRHTLLSIKELGDRVGPVEPPAPDAFEPARLESRQVGRGSRTPYDDLIEEEEAAQGGRIMPHDLNIHGGEGGDSDGGGEGGGTPIKTSAKKREVF